MNNNEWLSTYDMVCRVFNPHYKLNKKERAENEQNQKLRRG